MTKDNGIAIHKIIADEARRTEQVYLYSDMSKYCEGVGCAWLAIEPGVTDKPWKRRLQDDYNIIEAELIGILDALRKWCRRRDNMYIYSNWQPALRLIKGMAPSGELVVI